MDNNNINYLRNFARDTQKEGRRETEKKAWKMQEKNKIKSNIIIIYTK